MSEESNCDGQFSQPSDRALSYAAAMVARSFRPHVLIFVAASIIAFGIAAGLLAIALKF